MLHKLLLALACSLLLGQTADAADTPQVRMQTRFGDIVIELEADKAPQTVNNFLGYARDGFYDGTIFHRVIPGFMIQGGGYTPALQPKPTRSSIRNEADNGLKNLRGTIAMARTGDPHSASAQFFINVVNNPFLDHRGKSLDGWGYAVFGRVIQGMEIVDRIAALPTGGSNNPLFQDAPRQAFAIDHVSVITSAVPPRTTGH
ncbi:MAG: peptidyl-prolyl cis-trans isomerase [Gammaproteobacteria bacterium]|nr:peptidyl-prolyl cis-trans isomerase [Gammaproteobacteria bacterium]